MSGFSVKKTQKRKKQQKRNSKHNTRAYKHKLRRNGKYTLRNDNVRRQRGGSPAFGIWGNARTFVEKIGYHLAGLKIPISKIFDPTIQKLIY